MSENKLNQIYSERNRLAAGFARMALAAGFKAGVGIDPGKWPVLYVETPNGQVCWHIADHDAHVLDGLPRFSGEWDGSFRGREARWSVWPIGPDAENLSPDRQKGIALGFQRASMICREIAKDYMEAEGDPPVGVMKESKEADGAEACADAILEARDKVLANAELSGDAALGDGTLAPLGSLEQRLLEALKSLSEAVRPLQDLRDFLRDGRGWTDKDRRVFEHAASLVNQIEEAPTGRAMLPPDHCLPR